MFSSLRRAGGEAWLGKGVDEAGVGPPQIHLEHFWWEWTSGGRTDTGVPCGGPRALWTSKEAAPGPQCLSASSSFVLLDSRLSVFVVVLLLWGFFVVDFAAFVVSLLVTDNLNSLFGNNFPSSASSF